MARVSAGECRHRILRVDEDGPPSHEFYFLYAQVVVFYHLQIQEPHRLHHRHQSLRRGGGGVQNERQKTDKGLEIGKASVRGGATSVKV